MELKMELTRRNALKLITISPFAISSMSSPLNLLKEVHASQSYQHYAASQEYHL